MDFSQWVIRFVNFIIDALMIWLAIIRLFALRFGPEQAGRLSQNWLGGFHATGSASRLSVRSGNYPELPVGWFVSGDELEVSTRNGVDGNLDKAGVREPRPVLLGCIRVPGG